MERLPPQVIDQYDNGLAFIKEAFPTRAELPSELVNAVDASRAQLTDDEYGLVVKTASGKVRKFLMRQRHLANNPAA